MVRPQSRISQLPVISDSTAAENTPWAQAADWKRILPHPDRHLAFLDPKSLLPHEQVQADRFSALCKSIQSSGEIFLPLLVDAHSLVVLDGHHRLKAALKLDLPKVPVVLVHYANDFEIVLQSWGSGAAPAKHEVIARARSRRLYPPRSTRHRYHPIHLSAAQQCAA